MGDGRTVMSEKVSGRRDPHRAEARLHDVELRPITVARRVTPPQALSTKQCADRSEHNREMCGRYVLALVSTRMYFSVCG